MRASSKALRTLSELADAHLLSRDRGAALSEVAARYAVAITPALAESLERTEMLREQLKSSERLNEYYNAVVAELRASLEQIEAEDRAS